MRFDRLWINARLATMRPGGLAYGALEAGAIGAIDGRIAFAGPMADLRSDGAADIIDVDGRWITPGLIDCHTHLVHGGDRAGEFELRLQGASYEEIARAGGGILSTVAATRAASEDELVASALKRLDALIREGVTTVEVKSGYGLEIAAELKSLAAARRLGEERPVTLTTTFLGAHVTPPEFSGDSSAYIDHVIAEMLPAVHEAGLADALDAFCEGIAFSPREVERLFTAARALGLPVKIHAEQLSSLHGSALAARFGALSADHLEYAEESDIVAMAASGTAAVLLPGAFYTLRGTQKPPVDLLRRHGVRMAVATDANPGTSPLTSALLTLNMACTLFRLTPEEALSGMTREAAHALGRAKQIGTLDAGKWCDLAIWDILRPAELAYRIGFNPLYARVWRGT